MRCEQAKELFSDSVEHQLSTPLSLKLEQHLDQCEGCRQSYLTFERLWLDLSKMPTVAAPGNLLARVWRRVDEQAVARRRSWRPEMVWRGALAFSAAAALLLITMFSATHTEHAGLVPFAGLLRHTRSNAPVPNVQVELVSNRLETGPSGRVLVVGLRLVNTLVPERVNIYVRNQANLTMPPGDSPVWHGYLTSRSVTEIPLSVGEKAPNLIAVYVSWNAGGRLQSNTFLISTGSQ
ncbi:MAG: zf-HC2 domain-containing protein [Armatimonadetes bacterium]|nr:zf-HC2 domain-containing protein [Armatimonadota bacterium]